MDNNTKQALEAMEGRIMGRFEQVDAQFEKIDAQFEKIDTRFNQIDARFEQTDERIHDVETNLLKAFYDWAKPTDARINKTLPALDERLGWVEQRLAELERKNLERGM